MSKKVGKKKVASKKRFAKKRWFLKMDLDQEDGVETLCRGVDPSKLSYYEDMCEDGIDLIEKIADVDIRKPGVIIELTATVVFEGFSEDDMLDPVKLMKTPEGRQLISRALGA